jgi:hypothetical protein
MCSPSTQEAGLKIQDAHFTGIESSLDLSNQESFLKNVALIIPTMYSLPEPTEYEFKASDDA